MESEATPPPPVRSTLSQQITSTLPSAASQNLGTTAIMQSHFYPAHVDHLMVYHQPLLFNMSHNVSFHLYHFFFIFFFVCCCLKFLMIRLVYYLSWACFNLTNLFFIFTLFFVHTNVYESACLNVTASAYFIDFYVSSRNFKYFINFYVLSRKCLPFSRFSH